MAGPDWDVRKKPSTIMVRSRTLQQVRALMYKYRGAVESAVKQGATVKQQAEAEDEKLKAPRGGDDGGDQSIASNQPHDRIKAPSSRPSRCLQHEGGERPS